MRKESEKTVLLQRTTVLALLCVGLTLMGCRPIGRSRIEANQTSAIGSLKTISAGQKQFRSQCCVDEDYDGIGEFGTLGELSGKDTYRGSKESCRTSPFIPSVFSPCGEEPVGKSGYYFMVLLADNTSAKAKDALGADCRERDYIAVAWPVTYGKSGYHVFAMNSTGRIMVLDNDKGLWSGDKPPVASLLMRGIDVPGHQGGHFVKDGESGGVG